MSLIYFSFSIVQELCESRGGRPPNEPSGFWGRKPCYTEPCFGIGLSLSLICQLTSEDIKQNYLPSVLASEDIRQNEINESALPSLIVLIVSVDVN